MAVAVTGIGVISPLGRGRQAVMGALLGGRSALVSSPDLPGGVSARIPGTKNACGPGRARVLAQQAASTALSQARLDPSSLPAVGMTLGTIVGEAGAGLAAQRSTLSDGRRAALERTWNWETLTRRVARKSGLGGVSIPVSTACASGADAIGLGATEIDTGRLCAVVAGGVEILTPFQWEGFRRLGALDPIAVRPFGHDRRGTGLGEASCFWVLEGESSAKRRGATILGYVRGWATASDATSLVSPHPRGDGLFAAASRALEAAGSTPEDVALVLAHATGTEANDRAEAHALRRLFTRVRPPTTAIKGATGHCLGASAALEASVALWCLQQRTAPAVVGLRDVDETLPWTPCAGRAVELGAGVALTLAAGFGGQNAALVLELEEQ